VRGSNWVAVGTGVARLVSFVTNVAFARLFGPEWLGHYAILLTNINLFNTVASGGIKNAATKLTAESQGDKTRERDMAHGLLYEVVLSGVVLSAFLAAAGPWIAIWFYSLPELALPMIAAAPLVVLNGAMLAFRGILAGYADFRAASQSTALHGVLVAVLTMLGAVTGGLTGAMVGNGTATVIAAALLYRGVSERASATGLLSLRRPRASIRAHVVELTRPLFFSAISTYPVSYLAFMWVSRSPNGPFEVGLFQAALAVRSAISVASSTVTTPFVTSYLREHRNAKEAWERANCGMSVALCVACATPLLVYPSLLGVLLGSAFGSSTFTNVVTLVAISCGLSILRDTYQRRLLGDGEMRDYAKTNLQWAVIVLIGIYVIPASGALALAGAYLAGDVVQLVVLALKSSGARDKIATQFDPAVLATAGFVCVLGLTRVQDIELTWRIAGIVASTPALGLAAWYLASPTTVRIDAKGSDPVQI
jgi:O-antigen/teichoic acid export membrane protein